MKGILAGAVVFLVAVPLFAQVSGPAAPQDTDIVIPELMLQVEELQLQQVSAVLPDEGELALGRLAIQLPGAEELFIDEAAFAVALPGVVRPQDARSVFSSGRLGAGTANHIVGELSLFRLGVPPRFRLRFAHEGIDGYQFRDAGTGYFSSSNVIDGWFTGGTDRLGTEFEAGFSEQTHGLQGQSDYFSVGLRRTDASGLLRFTPDPVVSITAELSAGAATRILSLSGTDTVPREREFVVSPAAEARFGIRAVDIVLTTSYFLRFLEAGEIPVYQDVDVLAGVDITLPVGGSVSARAGVLWEPAAALRYPWSLSLELLFGEALETQLAGGYRVERLTLADLWSDVPQAGIGGTGGATELSADGQWYGGLSARWSGATGFSVAGGVDFAAHDARVEILPYDLEANRYPFSQAPALSLTGRVRAGWRPDPRVQIQAGWGGSFLDTPPGTPIGTIDGAVRIGDAGERLSAAAELRTDFYPEAAVPMLGLSGSFAPSDELEFSLELTDLFAPLLENGRPAIGAAYGSDYPFIAPGFRASLFTRISL